MFAKHRKFKHQVGIPVGLPTALLIQTMHRSLVAEVRHPPNTLVSQLLGPMVYHPLSMLSTLLGTMACHPQCMLVQYPLDVLVALFKHREGHREGRTD